MITALIILYAVVGIILLLLDTAKHEDVTVLDMLVILTLGALLWPIILIPSYWPKDILHRVVIKKRRK